MKLLLCALLALFSGSCKGMVVTDPSTGEERVDVERVRLRVNSLRLLAQDLHLATESRGEAGAASFLDDFAKALGGIDVALAAFEAGGSSASIREAISTAVESLDDVATVIFDDPDQRADVLFWSATSKAVLREALLWF